MHQLEYIIVSIVFGTTALMCGGARAYFAAGTKIWTFRERNNPTYSYFTRTHVTTHALFEFVAQRVIIFVYVRTTPNHKATKVRALKQASTIVAIPTSCTVTIQLDGLQLDVYRNEHVWTRPTLRHESAC